MLQRGATPLASLAGLFVHPNSSSCGCKRDRARRAIPIWGMLQRGGPLLASLAGLFIYPNSSSCGIARGALSLWGRLQIGDRHSLCSPVFSFTRIAQAALGSGIARGALSLWGRLQIGDRHSLCSPVFSFTRIAQAALGIRVNEKTASGAVSTLAEREGFEPPLPLRVKRFSRPPHSTALPPLQVLRTVIHGAAARK